ncbi:hypothetical protein [Bifidobacterium leontopitheci]|uniref:Uncharacterized protein n=1 Tax=Bifidobacterium leontopitheci TaxID=2650774 RepID=A0A6I1GGS3_9BIFI|nr:hypothetical protein [Bifidobacterium leontopitheci]KAB7790795.1 hypothetical protein F7D09_0711 [Bifidobacterium leontopitheci]
MNRVMKPAAATKSPGIGVTAYAVMTAIAALTGAAVSFAPLYVDIWGGEMMHPECPVINRMSYYTSGPYPGSGDMYGDCLTPLPWYAAITAIALVMTVTGTVVMLQFVAASARMRKAGRSKPAYRMLAWLVVPLLAAVALLVWGGNWENIVVWLISAAVWAAYALLSLRGGSDDSASGTGHTTAIIRQVLLAVATGVMPLFVAEYALSDYINMSGGAYAAFCLGLMAFALTMLPSTLHESREPASRGVTVHRIIVSIVAVLSWVWFAAMTWTYRSHGLTATDFCPATGVREHGIGMTATCIGSGALDTLRTLMLTLPAVSGVLLVLACVCIWTNRRRTATVLILSGSLIAAAAFGLAFTLVV